VTARSTAASRAQDSLSPQATFGTGPLSTGQFRPPASGNLSPLLPASMVKEAVVPAGRYGRRSSGRLAAAASMKTVTQVRVDHHPRRDHHAVPALVRPAAKKHMPFPFITIVSARLTHRLRCPDRASQDPAISKPARLRFDGVKQLQSSESERSPSFTPLGSPSAAEQGDRIETSTPPTSKLEQRAAAGSSSAPASKPQRQPLAPMARQSQPTAAAGAQQDAAAQALLALLADSTPAAAPTEPSRICNRAESLRQARMAHHRLRLSLGVQLRA
jgi:hypothetical protein